MKRNELEKIRAKAKRLQSLRKARSKKPLQNKTVILGLIMLFAITAMVTALNPVAGGSLMAASVGLISFAKPDTELTDEEKAFLGTIEKKLNENFSSLKKGFIDCEAFEKYSKSIEDQLKAFNKDAQWDEAIKDLSEWKESIKSLSADIQSLKEKGNMGGNGTSIKAFVEEIAPLLKEWRQVGQGAGKNDDMTAIKGVMSVTNNTEYDKVSPSIFVGITDYQKFYERRRALTAFILSIVNMGRTNSYAITYTEEKGRNGDAKLTAEGAIKPNVEYTTEDKVSKAIKIAAHFQITEEMIEDTPRLASKIEKLFNIDVPMAFHQHILQFIIDNANGYAPTALDGTITNPQHYDAVGAATSLMQSMEWVPDTVVFNPQDAMLTTLIKDTSGQYVKSPFSDTFLKLEVSTLVKVGHFILIDSSAVQVEVYKDYSLRYGWINDDFIKNQFTAVGEIRAHIYLPDNNKAGVMYCDFASIETALAA